MHALERFQDEVQYAEHVQRAIHPGLAAAAATAAAEAATAAGCHDLTLRTATQALRAARSAQIRTRDALADACRVRNWAVEETEAVVMKYPPAKLERLLTERGLPLPGEENNDEKKRKSGAVQGDGRGVMVERLLVWMMKKGANELPFHGEVGAEEDDGLCRVRAAPPPRSTTTSPSLAPSFEPPLLLFRRRTSRSSTGRIGGSSSPASTRSGSSPPLVRARHPTTPTSQALPPLRPASCSSWQAPRP